MGWRERGERNRRDIGNRISRLESDRAALLEAAKLAVLNFKRKNRSLAESDWLGDDDHEAWTALGVAIAKAEAK